MQPATYVIPSYLFELENDEGTPNGCGPELHAAAGDVSGRHNALGLRQPSGEGRKSFQSFMERGNTRETTLASGDITDRFGPGRLSRRHSHTKRLRELQARRSAGPVHVVRQKNVSRGVSCTAPAGTRGSKRRRASSGEACQVDRQRPPSEHPVAIVRPKSQQQQLPPTFGSVDDESRSAIRHGFRGEEVWSKGYCDDWNRRNTALNEAVAAPAQTPEAVGDADSRRCIGDSMAPLGSLDEGPSFDSGSANTAETSGQSRADKLSRILPVRSPKSWRPLAATSTCGASRSGSRKTPQANAESEQHHNARTQQGVDATISAVAAVPLASASASAWAASANINVGGWDSAFARSIASRKVGDAGGGHDSDTHKSPGSLAGSKLGYPGLADTCGGVVLRLTPAERSLEPWGTTLAPLRAMCDIDPSLSRAGMEYRGVIHAVEGAQELHSHHLIKQKKARDAKALLGIDIRPRTSEPRLRIAGATSEIDVLKTILVRERLIVTLRRLIRRLRRRCSKLQDFLRREIKFRWRYGKPPPELLICATQSVRKTLHTEQQELRVVLAHLRAISIDTVKAISEWRATFETSEPPGHRQISRNASAPSLHCKSPPLRGPTELQETSQCSSVVCHSHKIAEKAYDHQNDHDTTDNITILSGGVEAQQPKEDETETQHHNDLGFRGRNDDPTFRSKTACTQDGDSGGGGGSGGEGSSSRSSPPTIFLWKGNNYLVKMAHDLDFLDNVGVAAPVSAWLGFSVRFNPFLIPPEGHDVCEILRRGHEERCKEIAARRRQRLQQQQRLGNTGNGHRRFSRSRSRTNSGANRQRGSCDRDRSASYAHGHGGQEQQNEIGRALSNNAEGDVITPEATGTSQHPQCQRVQRDAGSNSTENVAPLTETTPAIALPGGEEGGATFVTEGGISMADESLDSASTSVEPQLLRGLGNFEDEDIPRELSSGEEEEVEWNGGGCLTVPIVPDLPDKVRSKASAATETLCCEGAAEQKMESIASEILANAKRTQEILRKPEEEHPSRVEWLAERSFKNGLRGALVDRHVGATRLKLVTSASCWRDEPLVRRASTAPAGGVDPERRARRPGADWACAKSAESAQEGHDPKSATFGTSRGGVCASADGGVENRDSEQTQSNPEPHTPARLRRFPSGSKNSTRQCGGASTSHPRLPDRFPGGMSEGSLGSLSATSLAERSMAASSLQASSSSMSARVRARATALRPTAMCRPFSRNGGKVIIIDPGKAPEVRQKAAMLIQKALLAASARLFVRRLRDDRERAALLIGQNWRRARARLRMWNAKRLRRAGELQRVAEERMRNRAAHLLQTFFRDIKYRRKRDRQALSLKNRDRIARERRELSAAIMVQSTIRRCIAFGRVKRMRHRRRGQAQTLIARAARQRATRVRQKQAEEREREEENASALAMMRKRGSLRPDEAAKRVQAWLRGAICRQTTVAEMLRAKEELAPTKRVYAPGSKSAHLKAALDALREAHSVMQSTENDKGKQNQEVRRRPVGNTSPSHRTRNSTTDTRRTEGRPSPNADELRWEARVSERKHTPPRDSSAKN